MESRILARLPAGDVNPEVMIEIDLSTFPWQFIVQDILARSSTVRELVVIQWMNDPTQRPDGFGASVSLITDKAIHHATSDDLLTHFRGRDSLMPAGATAATGDAGRHGRLVSTRIEDYGAPSRALETATCIWEAMLHFKKLHAAPPPSSRRTKSLLSIPISYWLLSRHFCGRPMAPIVRANPKSSSTTWRPR
ncbi:hypothetical protein [Aquamicrobium terrae]|uniref:Uncharacterized protein n=1 Tax=Aquamicrobium terrae TaxID=1324945 RepID=A0ABV2N2K4_9HYPH